VWKDCQMSGESKDQQAGTKRRLASAAIAQTTSSFAEGIIDNDDFRLLAENLPSLCWMANADGYIFWYNKRWHGYCGTTPQEMEGWGWQSVQDPEMLSSVLDRWQTSIATGQRFEMVFPLKGADGVFRPFLTKVEPLRSDDGQVVRWYGTNIEITSQRAAEEALQNSNAQLKVLAAEREATLRQLQEGVIVTDETGRITFVNAAAYRIHGVLKLDVGPQDYAQTYGLFTMEGEPHPLDQLPIYRAVTNCELVSGARWKIRRPDGSEIFALGNAGPVYGDDGSLIGAVLTIRDDTERHVAEQQLAEGARTQELLIAELNHRVKNAFAVVKSIVRQSLNRADVSAEVRTKIDDRLQAYANSHSRLMAGQWNQALLNELADEILGHHVREGRVKIDGPPVMLPAGQAIAFSMAFYELMTNAFKHGALTDPKGWVQLTWVLAGTDEPRINVQWQERGGPPASSPNSKGFGTFIIDRALTSVMNGEVTVEYGLEGYSWTLDAPLTQNEGAGSSP
jgi:PAS domain S-box-containing protein